MNSPNNQRPVVNELFNFFVRITKVEHLAHVVVATSDTFFIEEVYTNSALQECAKYRLLDFFDEETTLRILSGEGFSEEEARFVWDWLGGVPWELAEAVEAKRMGRLEEAIRELYMAARGRIEDMVERKKGREKGELKKALGIFAGREKVRLKDVPDDLKDTVIELVKAEILFYDPLSSEIKPHTKLIQRAIREVLR
jgi:AAA+ ATPase superfamily predicted ATPase